MIGLRAQVRPWTTSHAQSASRPPRMAKNRLVVMPIAARSACRWATSSTAYATSSRPSTAASEAATTSGGGGAEPVGSGTRSAYGGVPCAHLLDLLSPFVRVCDETD